jgi:hypothetical protein
MEQSEHVIRNQIEHIVGEIEKAFLKPRDLSTYAGGDRSYGKDNIHLSIRLDDWDEVEFEKHTDSIVRLIRQFKDLRKQESRMHFENEKALLIQREILRGIPVE